MGAEKPDKAAVGRRIAEAREAKGWTQIKLGAESGYTNTDIWRYEDGRTLPGHDKVEVLAKALGVTPSWLLWGREAVEAADAPMPAKRKRTILAWAEKHGYQDIGERMVEMLVGWGEIDETDLMTVAARARVRRPDAPTVPANKAALSPPKR